MDKTSINAERLGYNRGVIFGLTMAEILLLLIFCLLLFMKLLDDQRVKAEKQREEALEQMRVMEDKILTAAPLPPEGDSKITDQVNTLAKSALLLGKYDPQKLDKIVDALGQDPRGLEKLKLIPEDEYAELTTKKNQFPSKKEQHHKLSELVPLEKLEALVEGKLVEAGNNWPPIISLPDAKNYSFEVGSAQLTEEFKQQLRFNIATRILEVLKKYDADLIEVIGHTDLQPMNQAIFSSNLDTEAMNFFTHDMDLSLRPKDNAGLGFARALSVARELKNMPQLKKYTILPYSAAQMISPNETINLDINAFDSSELRRIEIRVRRKSP